MTERHQADHVEEIAAALVMAEASDEESLEELLQLLDGFSQNLPSDHEPSVVKTLGICREIIADIASGSASNPEGALNSVSSQITALQQNLRERNLKPLGGGSTAPSEAASAPSEEAADEPAESPVEEATAEVSAAPQTFTLPEWVEEATFKDFLSGRSLTLEEIEGDILALEKGDVSSISALLRRIHTLKGEAGALGLEGLELVCHALEDRLTGAAPQPSWADLLFAFKDWVDGAMDSYAEYELPSLSADEMISRIREADLTDTNGEAEVEAKSAIPEEAPPAEATPEVVPDSPPPEPSTEDDSPPVPTVDASQEVVERDEETIALLAEFLQEGEEGLAQVDSILMNIEAKGIAPDDVDAIFRVYHTIKGVAGFLELEVVAALAHTTENLLNKARKGEATLEGAILDLVFDATEAMRNLLQDVKDAVETSHGFGTRPEIPELIDRLKAAIAGQVPPEIPVPAVPKNTKVGEIMVMTGAATPDDVKEALETQKESKRPLGEELVATGKAEPRDVARALRTQKKAVEPAQRGAKLRETVKVDLERVDSLVELVGELVIVESMLAASPELGTVSSVRLQKYLSQLGKISRDLQSTGMQLRMIPLRGVFQKMARLVRDLSKKSHKKVRLIQSGESTEMDRSMVEQISDPLIHMIRNSVDHGVEEPEDRVAAGKPEEGTIFLSAYHEGSSIVISIRDDGRGLNREAIVKKAISQGLIRSAEHMSDSEVYNLIFAPGFSTAAQVTQISGRGVGMDVVKKNIEAMRGRTAIDSVPGRGTEFKLILPLTLAIIDGMLVSCGGEQYIIPTLSIIESIQPDKSMLYSMVDRAELVNVRGEIMPMLRLDQLLEIEGAEKDPTRALVIVVEAVGQKVGVLVDDVLTQQQVVIKNLGRGFKDAGFLAGATILSDGRAGLILNVDELGGLARQIRVEAPSVEKEMALA